METQPAASVVDHPARILIVDDDRDNRQLLQVMLAKEGYRIDTAASGEEALLLVAKQAPDLILLDILMPGMNGYEVVTRVKQNPATRNIPVVMVTMLDEREARVNGLLAGAEELLTKPIDPTELRVRVRNLLRLKAYGDQHDRHNTILEGKVVARTAELAESELLYRTTFDAAPVGIVHVGLDGQWLRVNQRLCDLLGYSREELKSETIRVLIQSDDGEGEVESFRQMAAGMLDHHVVDEKRYRRRDGSSMWARIIMSVHRYAGGRPQHLIWVIEDVTERRTLEAQIRQASKMDAIGRLASGVAHDFNNLLTVIIGCTELMSHDVSLAGQSREDLAEIINAAQRASGLTRQLLAFSRQQVLHAVPLDVNGLITDMTGMLGRLIGEHIEVTLNLAADVSLAVADRGQLEQVIMNLVVNGRDAMPDGGRLTIETSDVELENSSFHEEPIVPGRFVMLAITDTGSGMTRETQRRLFEPFFTTKGPGKGTGLGLSTTYGIIKQSKGYIWVYSEPGRGTTFKVYLPRSNDSLEAQVAKPADAAPVESPSETILLVEDEDGVRQLAKRILVNAGYRVLEAPNGQMAEALFAAHADSIALVVTDVIMPGVCGPELVARLKLRSPSLRVLFMSGYTEHAAMKGVPFQSGLPFVQKPFTTAELERKVREAINRTVD